MDAYNHLYGYFLIISGVVALWVIGLLAGKNRVAGSRSIIALMSGLAIWCLSYAAHWFSVTQQAQAFWLQFSYVGVVLVPSSLLLFAIQITLREGETPLQYLLLISIEPLLTLVLMWTDPWHGLFFGEAGLPQHSIFTGGPFFWLNTVYSYLLIIVSIFLLFHCYFRSPRFYRRQFGLLINAMLLPFASNLISFLGYNPLPDLDLTPFAFTLTGLLFTIIVQRHHLLDIVPLASHLILNNLSDGVMVLDRNGRVVEANPTALSLVGVGRDEALGAHSKDLFSHWKTLLPLLESESASQTEVTFGNGRLRYFDLRITPLDDKKGRRAGTLLLWHDITDRKRVEAMLRQSEQNYRMLMENAPFPVLVTSLLKPVTLYVNARAAWLFEMELPAVNQDPRKFYVDPQDREQLIATIQVNGGQVMDYEVRLQTSNHRPFWALMTANATEFDGQPALVVSLADITARKQAEDDLRKLTTAVEQSAATIVITDLKGQITYANPAFTLASGYTIEEALGNNPRILKSGELSVEVYQELWSTILSGQTWHGMFHNRRKDGSLYWESATISPVRNNQGEIINFVAIKDDVTARVEAETELQRVNMQLREQIEEIERLQSVLMDMAIRDPLTDLYNRRYLEETLPRELARAAREGYPISLVFIDIDHFKRFNDTHGHAAGDTVLQVLAQRLLQMTRKSDIVARYGGEEFLVVLTNASLQTALQRAEQIRAVFEGLEIPYDGLMLNATLSLGVACYPQHGSSLSALVSAADQALYMAKDTGRNRVCVFAGNGVNENTAAASDSGMNI